MDANDFIEKSGENYDSSAHELATNINKLGDELRQRRARLDDLERQAGVERRMISLSEEKLQELIGRLVAINKPLENELHTQQKTEELMGLELPNTGEKHTSGHNFFY